MIQKRSEERGRSAVDACAACGEGLSPQDSSCPRCGQRITLPVPKPESPVPEAKSSGESPSEFQASRIPQIDAEAGNLGGPPNSDGDSIAGDETLAEGTSAPSDSLSAMGTREETGTREDSGRERDAGSGEDSQGDEQASGSARKFSTRSETIAEHDTVHPRGEDDPSGVWADGAHIADRFRVAGFIGQGGMGKVYLAQDESLQRQIALKRIPQEILFDVDARDDLRQEANRLLDLAHENIVRIHTYYDGPTWPFFAMEYLRGPTLKKLLRDRKRQNETFSAGEVLNIARDVGRGLQHAHSRNIVHRDLKPANLMLADPIEDKIDESAVVKITDFGISRVVADSTLRQTGKRSGTLPYMSPEQYLGEASTVQSDIYSFACTLYELLTGKTPFTTGDIGYQILNVPVKTIPRGVVPKAMAEAIERALAKDPKHRFESVEQFVDALEGKVRVPSPGFTSQIVSLGAKMALGALFILLVVAIGQMFWQTKPPGNDDDPPARPPRFGKEDLDRIGNYLRAELARQVGVGLGRSEGLVGDERDFTLKLIAGPSGIEEEALDKLDFYFRRMDVDSADRAEVDKPTEASEEWGFRLQNLREGPYEIKAFLRMDQEPIVQLPVVYQFRVDTTVPLFEVRFASVDRLVDALNPATFDDAIEMYIVPSDGDRNYIESVSYRVVGPTSATSPELVADRDAWRWTVQLDEPGDYRIEVSATDKTGNTSEAYFVDLRRRLLEIRELAVKQFRGANVQVEGSLLFEGEVAPTLWFFVNDQLVQHKDLSTKNVDARDEDKNSLEGGISLRPFLVELPLDRPQSSVHLGYSVPGEDPTVFDEEPMRLPEALSLSQEQVLIPAPDIILAPFPGATRRSSLTLEGTVRPYFPGLEVNVKSGKASQSVELTPDGDEARFQTTVQLLRDQMNVISFLPRFKSGDLITPPSPRVEVRHDEISPECDQVYTAGEEGDLEIIVSEALSAVQVDWVTDDTSAREFTDVMLERIEDEAWVIYRISPPKQPHRDSEIDLILVDLAGNSNRSRQRVLSGTESVGAPTVPATAIVPRSVFLKEYQIRFIDIGEANASTQLMSSEVPARVWRDFLIEQGANVPAGEAGLPMVLGERPTGTVGEFIEWFEKRSDDGWDYFVPTFDQWICAFADVEELPDAESAIRNWFKDEFDSAPKDARYGTNTTSPIGSRKVNASPAGFLDMESNLQELVRVSDVGSVYAVIGGHNQHTAGEGMISACVRWRTYDNDRRAIQGGFTGLRLARRPRGSAP